MLHLDQAAKGRYIKIGQWVQLKNIVKGDVAVDGQGRHLKITRKGKPPLIYRGPLVDKIKKVLDTDPDVNT